MWPTLLALSAAGKHQRINGLTQDDLEEFCKANTNNHRLRYLTIFGNIRGYKVTDFSVLSTLPELTELYIDDAITQDQFDQICSLGRLTGLHIDHGGKMSNIESVSNLKDLTSFSVTVPAGWLSKLLYLQSLRPIAKLTNIQELYFAGVAFEHDGLTPLRGLKRLERLIVISRYWNDASDLMKYCPRLKRNESWK